jgi:N-methylhydantoinase A/oxoprolinase/acetone carboxylase beta subunit
MIGIGIDTGGTYTDAVAYDFDTGKIIGKGKSPTTRDDLSRGIRDALRTLPEHCLREAASVSVSTTLATNACVENKGGRAKLVLMGATRDLLKQINAEKKYGLKPDNVLCLENHDSFDGSVRDDPDWDAVIGANDAWFREADALSIAALYSVYNGANNEKNAKQALSEHYRVPIIMAHELAAEKNVMERGATALLNARLLPVMQNFIESVEDAIAGEGISAAPASIRSDGSLMSNALALQRPVDTILSGPAASILGGSILASEPECVIVDMGGTTTDISLVKGGAPKMADAGIRIGGWRTQIKGVYINTCALGGDSAVHLNEGTLTLSPRRVIPYCMAASMWPGVREELRRLAESSYPYSNEFHEILILLREPEDSEKFSQSERALCRALRNGPRMIRFLTQQDGVEKYCLNTERLEAEGIIIRSGLTPTDIMHISGDFTAYDTEASRLAAEYYMRCMHLSNLERFCSDVYDLVSYKLYLSILTVVLDDQYPGVFANGLDPQMSAIANDFWQRKDRGLFDRLGLRRRPALVGIGAPTHIFLQSVADVLGARCVIPEHAEVANALGAVAASVNVHIKVEIHPVITYGVIESYTVHAPHGVLQYKYLKDAFGAAKKAAEEEAEAEARRRGALGELSITSTASSRDLRSGTGSGVQVDICAEAWATNRFGSMINA